MATSDESARAQAPPDDEKATSLGPRADGAFAWGVPALALIAPFAIDLLRGGDGMGLIEPGWQAWGPTVLLVGSAIAIVSALGRALVRPRRWLRPLAGLAWGCAGGLVGLDLQSETPAIDAALAERVWAGTLLALCASVLITLDATRKEIVRGIDTEMRR